MSVERLLAAAKAVLKRRPLARCAMSATRGEFEAEKVDADFFALEAAISDAESQADDDALPYSSEWAVSEFGAWFFRAGGVEVLCAPKGVSLNGVNSYCSEVKTRGQLRRLVAALKGGE